MGSSGRETRDAPPPIPEPVPGGVIDSHTHLDACGATDPAVLAAVLDRASEAGVTAMVTTADDLASAQWAAGVAGADPRVFAAVGLHPTRSRDLDDAARAEIEAPGRAHRGWWRSASPGSTTTGRPGARTARRWTCSARRSPGTSTSRSAPGWRWWSTTATPTTASSTSCAPRDRRTRSSSTASPADPELARICAEQGWLMSFSGTATFRNANAADLRRAAAAAPAELVLTETDAPFLTPHPVPRSAERALLRHPHGPRPRGAS